MKLKSKNAVNSGVDTRILAERPPKHWRPFCVAWVCSEFLLRHGPDEPGDDDAGSGIADSADRRYLKDMEPIRIVAALIVEDGRALLVRKAGTRAFMQPGGKLEPGEAPEAALQRELIEELGCGFDWATARRLGRFEAPAANEPGRFVDAEIWRVALTGRPKALAEIEELAWVEPSEPNGLMLAPLTRDFVLPLIAEAN